MGFEDMKWNKFVMSSTSNLKQDRQRLCMMQPFRLDIRKYSFSRVNNEWNLLPNELIGLCKTQQFQETTQSAPQRLDWEGDIKFMFVYLFVYCICNVW